MVRPAQNESSPAGLIPASREPRRSARRSSRHLASLAGWIIASGLAGSAIAAEPAGPAGVNASPGAVAPHTQAYDIRAFLVSGSTRLSREQVDRLLADATGPAIPLPRIRASLVRLQQAYRDAGLPRAAVLLPRQSLADGLVRVTVVEDASQPAPATLPAWSEPAFQVRHFIIQGNSLLSAEEIDSILGPIEGDAVRTARLEGALRSLRDAYVARGHSNAVVRAPSQVLTDGTLVLAVEEGPQLRTPVAATRTNSPPAPAFEVRRYDVRGDTLLGDATIQSILAAATGEKITLAQIQKALGELQLAYRERGWATVSVSLPQQQLTNATVRVQITQGVLTDVQVTGNRHFSSNNVMRALPSLRTNALLNSRVFQRELDLANQNRDRQIYPVLGPGPDPGTSALTLRVKDRLPVHGRVELNNQVTPATPEWRINSSVQHRNLWQREHQAGLSYGFSPEAFKDSTPRPDFLLNRPQLSFYGGYYRMPFGDPESVEEQIRSNRAFGFDEASRQFRLPPAGTQPDLTLFASAASTDTGIQRTPARTVSQTPLLTIVSQDTGRNVIGIEAGGARLNLPLALDDKSRLAFSAGIEAKHFGVDIFNTNNFIITTVVTNAQGSQTIRSDVASPQPSRANSVFYLPLSLGVDYSRNDSHGSSLVSLNLVGNVLGNEDDFRSSAYSREADPLFAKASLTVRREQKLPSEWALSARAVGQIATGPLLPLEQLPLGGMSSVRGYYEGDDIGDLGWSGGIDLLTPQFRFNFAGPSDPLPSWIRGFVFFDAGQRFQSDGSVTAVDTRTLWSTGFGLSANLNNVLDLRVTIGVPLADSPNRQSHAPRANISLGGQF